MGLGEEDRAVGKRLGLGEGVDTGEVGFGCTVLVSVFVIPAVVLYDMEMANIQSSR